METLRKLEQAIGKHIKTTGDFPKLIEVGEKVRFRIVKDMSSMINNFNKDEEIVFAGVPIELREDLPEDIEFYLT
tara:strand:+ start:1390 stop:1614 length:225 start_codon:yes stop_codon:yes gene_type:complete